MQVYYDEKIDAGRFMSPPEGPMKCSSSDCDNDADRRDDEGYPWCYDCA